ncbi:MAG: M1 family metallopeptidase [Flavisolibacter sp.]
MYRKRSLVICIATLFISSIEAQKLDVPRNILRTYQKGTRSADGSPGKNYWQNHADYSIHVNFSPDTRLVNGTEDISYTNNSPDTLHQVWIKLYPNLYKTGSPRQSKISPEDAGAGMVIDSMWINQKRIDRKQWTEDATNMVVGKQNISHGQLIRFRILFHYTLNKGSHIRTGEVEPNADFVAYFFPRIAVYDDIDGWNRNPYNGSQEFYNDFCNFDVNVTVPKNFLVWATGNLENGTDVLKPLYLNRIHQAENSDDITTIIDSTDLSQTITAENNFNTWHYRAENVTDFVFATSDHYLWRSSSLVVDPISGRRTRVDAVFNKKHRDYFAVIGDARKTVWSMSYVFPHWPYPYSHETVFDGLDQMEYPMMVNDNPVEDRGESIELTDHEIFHTMFPFYMGINETKYGWMDEGWATIGEWLISPIIDTTIVDEYGVQPYEKDAGSEIDLPIITLTTQLTGIAMFLDSYPKPAFGYLYIKDLLGDSVFTKALHYYIQQWQGKHPMPYDFFNCINAGSGKNLNWFWKRWFFDNGFPDLSISSVTKKLNAYAVKISMKGTKPTPIDLDILYSDKTTEKLHRSIAVWEKSDEVTITIPTSKKISSIHLGSTYMPDVNHADNDYSADSKF